MSRPNAGSPAHTYAAAGVDHDARRRFIERIAPIARSTHRPEVLSGIGPFGGLFQLGSYRQPVLVSSTDSVGTKVKIAALLDRFEGIGIDLVNQSVNDILTSGAEPLFFLDYMASSTLTDDQKTAMVEGVAAACRDAGCALIGGETADMPDLYAEGDLDFVGFVVGVVERDEIIDGSAIREGDALLALPSSGLHTNGYSLVRRIFGVGIGGDRAEERTTLERHYDELDGTLGEALLTPHRSYVREVQAVRSRVRGIAHITGGGLDENVARILPEGLGARIDRDAWAVPPIFGLIQREGNVPEDEMWRAFNMGLGLVLAVDPPDVDAVLAALPEALVVGEVVADAGERVTLS